MTRWGGGGVGPTAVLRVGPLRVRLRMDAIRRGGGGWVGVGATSCVTVCVRGCVCDRAFVCLCV